MAVASRRHSYDTGLVRIIYRQVSAREIHLNFTQTRNVGHEIFEKILEIRIKNPD